MPVGDLPRAADLVLLRRKATGRPPFRGLWRHLTTWNVLEYKGPTVTPRQRDLPLLVELGLGIDRRLNEERMQQGRQPLSSSEMSFWYIANHLGQRFLRAAEGRLGRLEVLGDGVWRGSGLGYPCLLVSIVDLPVDEDSLPLHVLAVEPEEKERAVGRFLVEQPKRLYTYGGVFATFHSRAWKEFSTMAKSVRKRLEIDFRPAIETLGLDMLIEQIGKKELIEQIGKKEFLEQIGKKELIEQIGKKELLEQLDVEDILTYLPTAKRRELKRRLRETDGN